MEREGLRTIQNSPFHLTSPRVGGPRRQMEQTGSSHIFEQVEVWEADNVTWGCTKNRKNLPAF